MYAIYPQGNEFSFEEDTLVHNAQYTWTAGEYSQNICLQKEPYYTNTTL
jgi:hypothetical protein